MMINMLLDLMNRRQLANRIVTCVVALPTPLFSL